MREPYQGCLSEDRLGQKLTIRILLIDMKKSAIVRSTVVYKRAFKHLNLSEGAK